MSTNKEEKYVPDLNLDLDWKAIAKKKELNIKITFKKDEAKQEEQAAAQADQKAATQKQSKTNKKTNEKK